MRLVLASKAEAWLTLKKTGYENKIRSRRKEFYFSHPITYNSPVNYAKLWKFESRNCPWLEFFC